MSQHGPLAQVIKRLGPVSHTMTKRPGMSSLAPRLLLFLKAAASPPLDSPLLWVRWPSCLDI